MSPYNSLGEAILIRDYNIFLKENVSFDLSRKQMFPVNTQRLYNVYPTLSKYVLTFVQCLPNVVQTSLTRLGRHCTKVACSLGCDPSLNRATVLIRFHNIRQYIFQKEEIYIGMITPPPPLLHLEVLFLTNFSGIVSLYRRSVSILCLLSRDHILSILPLLVVWHPYQQQLGAFQPGHSFHDKH